MTTIFEQFKGIELRDYIEHISKYTRSDVIKYFIRSRPFYSKKEVKRIYNILSKLGRLEENLPDIELFSDSILFFKKLSYIGSYLEINELIELYYFIEQIPSIIALLKKAGLLDEYPLGNFKQLEQLLKKYLDLEEKDIKKNATPTLKELYNKYEHLEYGIKNRIEQLFRKYEKKGFLNENFYTVKNEHFVLPVSVWHKNQIEGVIHFYSNSGLTAYVEPIEIVNSSNNLMIIKAEIEQEKLKILHTLFDKIKPFSDELSHSYELLLDIGINFTIIRFLKDHNYSIPSLGHDYKLYGLRHPILDFKGSVVPYDFIQKDKKVFVISGPNTGGKTILLKSLSLVAILTKLALPIPAKEDSEVVYFNDIIIDIEDNQSVKESLSTFSSHLVKLREFLQKGDEKTFAVFDEPLSGTEYNIGDAFTEELLEEAIKRKSFLMISSHSIRIKEFAIKNNNIEIGAMLFDQKNYSPTYKFEIGLSGDSYAIEIAKRYKIADEFLQGVKERIGENYFSLSREKQMVQEKLFLLEEKIKHYEELIKENEQLNKQFNMKLKELKKDFINNYEQLLSKLQFDYEQLKKEIATLKKEEKNRLMKIIDREEKLIDSIKEEALDKKSEPQKRDIEVGDFVRLESSSNFYQVVEVNKKSIRVAMGEIFLEVSEDMIEEVKKGKKEHKEADFHVKTTKFHQRIDVRGFTLKEALIEVEKLLNNAYISGIKEVSILHGKGSGILRIGIGEYLQKHPFVKDFYPENNGVYINEGITIVELRSKE